MNLSKMFVKNLNVLLSKSINHNNMTSFKELTVEELQSISGGGWSLLLRLAKVVGGAILAYYTVETIQGVEEGIAMECCDCECP
jgi:lactobin A/cerein 7B family class IIb bacteriocin